MRFEISLLRAFGVFHRLIDLLDWLTGSPKHIKLVLENALLSLRSPVKMNPKWDSFLNILSGLVLDKNIAMKVDLLSLLFFPEVKPIDERKPSFPLPKQKS
jgi:hypothetical protein